jgi:hypothetical protein
MFVIEFLLDFVLFPFRKFPKTTIAILVILAGAGAGGAAMLHSVAANLGNEGCTVVTGHTGCIHLPKK